MEKRIKSNYVTNRKVHNLFMPMLLSKYNYI